MPFVQDHCSKHEASAAVAGHWHLKASHQQALLQPKPTSSCPQVLAAGSDKSLHLWDVASSQTRHTLTGHSAAVTGASAGPLDNRVAASCSEDRWGGVVSGFSTVVMIRTPGAMVGLLWDESGNLR